MYKQDSLAFVRQPVKKKENPKFKAGGVINFHSFLLDWLFGFYGKSTFMGYLMPIFVICNVQHKDF